MTARCSSSSQRFLILLIVVKDLHLTPFSLRITKSDTLPLVTYTSYTSTVLVPSGPTPIVDKRSLQDNRPRATTPAPAPTNVAPTIPSALAAYPSSILSAGCSSLLSQRCSTTIRTQSTTTKIPCTITSTSYTIKYAHTTISTQTIYPAPIFVSGSNTLTTTVPTACARSAYLYEGADIPDTEFSIAVYPNFPQTNVECCVLCFRTKGCVANAFLDGV